MYEVDLSGKVALITGGTRGIGLATARSLARAGARCVMTYKWGSADLEGLKDEFESMEAPQPVFKRADVSYPEDTEELIDELSDTHGSIDIFVSNVAFGAKTPDLDSYEKRSLFTSLEYSAWPLVDYVKTIEEKTGAYPEYVVAISSDGIDRSYPGYDFVAASKTVLETLTRYLGSQLADENCTVNAIRFGMVATESFEAMFGNEVWEFFEREGIDRTDLLAPEECGRAVLGICSGLFDAMNSEVITVDRGMGFGDNMMRRYERWLSDRANNE